MQAKFDKSKSGLFFLHVPKTGGVSLKAALENGFAARECCVEISHSDDAFFETGADLNQRFATGHAGPNATRIVASSHNRVTALRHPVERFISDAIHGYRHRQSGELQEAFGDEESALRAVCRGEPKYFQNHYLCHALDKPAKAGHWQVGPADLDAFSCVGVLPMQRKFLQVLTHEYGLLPGVGNWRLNSASNSAAIPSLAAKLVPLLHLFQFDMETYQLATERFLKVYRHFLESLFDDRRAVNLASDDVIEQQMLSKYLERLGEKSAQAEELNFDMLESQPGPGWWWRESNHLLSYRWLGPETVSKAYFAPMRRRDYDLAIEIVAVASPRIGAEFTIWVGDHRIEHTLEVVSDDPHDVKYIVRGIVRAYQLPPKGSPLELRFEVPETLPALAQYKIAHSLSTSWHDTRALSIAVARIRLQARASLHRATRDKDDSVAPSPSGTCIEA